MNPDEQNQPNLTPNPDGSFNRPVPDLNQQNSINQPQINPSQVPISGQPVVMPPTSLPTEPQQSYDQLSMPGQQPQGLNMQNVQQPQTMPSTFVGPENQAAGITPMPTVAGPQQSYGQVSMPNQPSSAKKRLIFKAAIALGVLIVLLIGVLLALKLVKGNMTYSASDLSVYNGMNYSVNYPKQWKNISTNQKLLNSLGLSVAGYDDVGAFAYKLDSSGTNADSALVVEDTSSGASNSFISKLSHDSNFLNTLKSTMQQSINLLSQSGGLCTNATNKTDKINFNTANFTLELSFSLDCTSSYNNVSQKIHIIGLIGYQNGYAYFAFLLTNLDDWNRNTNFYEKDVIGSIQPKGSAGSSTDSYTGSSTGSYTGSGTGSYTGSSTGSFTGSFTGSGTNFSNSASTDISKIKIPTKL